MTKWDEIMNLERRITRLSSLTTPTNSVRELMLATYRERRDALLAEVRS